MKICLKRIGKGLGNGLQEKLVGLPLCLEELVCT